MALGKLHVRYPDGQVQEFSLEKHEITIGRSKENDLSIPHITISRQHALLKIDAGILILEDLDSANGSFVGERQIKSHVSQPVLASQPFRLGDIQITFIPALLEQIPLEEVNTLSLGNMAKRSNGNVTTMGTRRSRSTPHNGPREKDTSAFEIGKMVIPIVGTLIATCLSGMLLLLSNNWEMVEPFFVKKTPTAILLTATMSPTVTATLKPEPTKTAAPTLSPWVIDAKDDFSHSKSGWVKTETESTGADYKNGGFELWVNNAIISAPYPKNYKEVQIEAETVEESLPGKNAFGMFCGYQDDANYYYFLVNHLIDPQKDTFEIRKAVKGEYIILNSTSVERNQIYHHGEASNLLKAECNGSVLRFFVNKKQVVESQDNTFSNGEVGFLIFSSEGEYAVRFDNFSAFTLRRNP